MTPPVPFIGRPGTRAVDRLGPRRRIGRVGVDEQVLQPAVDHQRRGVAAGGQRLDQDLPALHGARGDAGGRRAAPRVSVSGRPTTFE